MRSPVVLLWLTCSLLAAPAGCVRVNSAFGDGAAQDDGAASGVDAGAGGAGYPTREAYCKGKGPPVILTSSGAATQPRCTGKLAQTAFRYALCSCKSYGVTGPLKIDSFDSSKGGYAAQQPGAAGAAGVNGAFTTSAGVDVGPLYVGSPAGLMMVGDVTSRAQLHCNGPVLGQGALAVAGDARIRGNVVCSSLAVGGTLTQPPGAYALAQGASKIANKQAAAVTVPLPCDCSAQHVFDVAGYVRTYAKQNDNAAAGFKRDALQGFAAGTRLELPCGRLYLSGMVGAGKLTLHVTGRTALFVGGTASLSGPLVVELDGGAELDLFIEGGLLGAAGVQLSGGAAPADVRLYVGGSSPIALGGGGKSTFGGNLYAPAADLCVTGDLELYGALFVGRLLSSAAVTIHYDQAILTVGDDCPPRPGGCKTCRDCGGQACVEGVCGKCTSDADCCAPLLCAAGACVPPLQ